jgi:hypothetical protein
VLDEFERALADNANAGKGDRDLFDALTKDKGYFASQNPPSTWAAPVAATPKPTRTSSKNAAAEGSGFGAAGNFEGDAVSAFIRSMDSFNSGRKTQRFPAHPSHRQAAISTRPSGRNETPSASNKALRISGKPPLAIEPSAMTTRCQGKPSGQKRMARPTSRAARGLPSLYAI